MENNKNGCSKSMLQSNDPKSDGATNMSPTSGEGTSTRNIKMLPVSYSVLDSGCWGPLKREIGTIINNLKIKYCEDEEDDASKLKDVVECVNINVRYFNGSRFSVQVALESTVESFKVLIVGNSGIPIQNQRLIYKGKILQNDQSLQSYGLGANHTVHLVRCFAPTDTDDGTDNSDTDTITYDDADSEGDDDLLREEDFQPMQPPYGFANPSSVRDFFDTLTMQYLIVNPDILWDILMNNEELPPNAVIDPSIVSQTLEAERNPAIIREMMRLSDLELNNIESSPDGFNTLRRSTTDYSDLEGTLDGNVMPNVALQTQLVQDPPTQQFIEFISSNPETLCQFGDHNIEQHGMPDLSSLREEIQNSEFLRLSQSETFQQPLSFWEEDILPELSQQQSMQELSQITGDTETAEQLYASQLSQLQEMGFNDTEENIRALILTSGDIHAAVRHLWWLLHQ
ncbi:hypothetical protein TSUD_192360 [Trifolium subterraneum]|uniref:Ubiquitin-like domain-containing protein n=1 Tax=Trifolium subterraneum TaxID=3900 RepID=A0A2Z6PR08_TRISU|nr:hypothetical protein TSUD_192360 [Trifolium subterraneum]